MPETLIRFVDLLLACVWFAALLSTWECKAPDTVREVPRVNDWSELE